MLVLVSLLLSAMGAAYYFYDMNQKALQSNKQLRVVYHAKSDIKKNSIIKESNLKGIQIEKRFILATPLSKKEIVNKVAKENIYKNDMFRKEKLATKKDIGEAHALKYKSNSYNIGFNLFRNPNYSLKQGDYIKIVSVYPDTKGKNTLNYHVQYVANNIQVIGFLEKGKSVRDAFRSVKTTVKGKNKKPVTKTVTKYANELLLDIDSKIILSLIDDYNKGNQLWMVKSLPPKSAKKDKKETVKKVATSKRRYYPTKWYVPRDIVLNKKGTIRYADTHKIGQTQESDIKLDMQQMCNDKEKLLIGISNKVYVRGYPSFNGRIKRIVYKNYLIPYKRKVSKDWYEVCDGNFVHINETALISKESALKKIK